MIPCVDCQSPEDCDTGILCEDCQRESIELAMERAMIVTEGQDR